MAIRRILHHPSPIVLLFQGIWLKYAFTIVALNDLDILAADIENAYLSDPNQEKFWIRDGPEFGNL